MADAGNSNIDDVEAWERQLIDSFDFTRPGEDQSLGRDMAGDVAMGIIDRTVAEQRDVNGSPLKPNKDPYKTWKEVKLGVYQPLIKTGQMMSLLSVKGEVAVSPDEVVMTYGVNDADEDGVTDRQKAEWNSDERPFYAMDDKIVATLVDRASDAFDRAAKEIS